MNNRLLIFLLLLLLMSCGEDFKKAPYLSFDLKKANHIDTLSVGNPVIINHAVSEKNLDDVKVKIENAYGIAILDIQPLTSQNKITIPRSYTLKKGILSISIFNGERTLLNKQFYLKPLQNVAVLENYFGQKFIHLDRTENPEIVSIILDSLDNTTSLNAPLNYESIQNQIVEKRQIAKANHLAVFEIPRTETIGKKSISVHYKNIHSEEEAFYILAGAPNDFTIKSRLSHNLADGNTVYEIKSSTIKDQFGNLVNDGTQIVYTLTYSDGSSLQKQAATINGIARVELLHPVRECDIQIVANALPNAGSNKLSLHFRSAITEIPIELQGRKLKLGPIVTSNQNYVPHATEVKIVLLNKDQKIIRSWRRNTENGRIEMELPSSIKDGEYYLEMNCLGYTSPLKKIRL